MAYDERLATRIRALLGEAPDVTEKKMFGGLAFLVRGNMAIAASGEGGILVRVDPVRSGELVATTDAHVAEMRGRLMPGWLRVDADKLDGGPALDFWVQTGSDFARSLPAKGQ
jgi:TfoX/Sxy family transcriptional regulator of competence genes